MSENPLEVLDQGNVSGSGEIIFAEQDLAEVIEDEGEGIAEKGEEGGAYPDASTGADPDDENQEDLKTEDATGILAIPKTKPESKASKEVRQKRETFHTVCSTIAKKALYVIDKTGAEVFFIARRVPGTKIDYQAGTDFTQVAEGPTILEIHNSASREDVRNIVDEIVDTKLIPLLNDLRASNTSVATPSTSSASIFSPMKTKIVKPVVKAKDCCDFCGKTEVVKDSIKFDSEWVRCSGDDKPCLTCAHAFCLGFPGANEKTITSLPAWYCESHRNYGAGKNSVNVSISSTPPPPPKKGRGATKRKLST